MTLQMATKRQIIERQIKPYRRANRRKKSEIISALTISTGLSREHIVRVLRGKYRYQGTNIKDGRGRKPIYGMEHKRTLVFIWELLSWPSSRRLAAAMKDVLINLEKTQRLCLDDDLKTKMLAMSHGTMDRLLRHDRRIQRGFGRSTTKPGSLLKSQIPMRRGTDWDNNKPGFMEIDLVAHCGEANAGTYICTLDGTDVASGWTECRAVLNKARTHTLEAMKDIRVHLPIPLLGIDSDNGSEFINDHFLHYCKTEKLVFTRSRPNHSNDSCYVEQKNWSVVRRYLGYARLEGQNIVDAMNDFYYLLSLYNNFFLPSQKLIQRQRNGDKVQKKHDRALTPYRRLLKDPNVDSIDKQRLTDTYQTLDIIQIHESMQTCLERIADLTLRYQTWQSNQ